MHISEYNINGIRSLLVPVFKRYPVQEAVLFGSYAKGTATEYSDVDLMVDSGLTGLEFCGLLEDIVTVLNKEVDLIDVQQIRKGSPIDIEIQKTGVMIYERQR